MICLLKKSVFVVCTDFVNPSEGFIRCNRASSAKGPGNIFLYLDIILNNSKKVNICFK